MSIGRYICALSLYIYIYIHMLYLYAIAMHTHAYIYIYIIILYYITLYYIIYRGSLGWSLTLFQIFLKYGSVGSNSVQEGIEGVLI